MIQLGDSLLRWLDARRDTPLGRRGEREAARFLRRAGYRILARNLQFRTGEIDLLAQAPDGRTVVIVEVKTLRENRQRPDQRPERNVTYRKRRKLTHLGRLVIKRFRYFDRPVRFDVIAIIMPDRGRPQIRHHVAAFEAVY